MHVAVILLLLQVVFPVWRYNINFAGTMFFPLWFMIGVNGLWIVTGPFSCSLLSCALCCRLVKIMNVNGWSNLINSPQYKFQYFLCLKDALHAVASAAALVYNPKHCGLVCISSHSTELDENDAQFLYKVYNKNIEIT